ncbi:putative GTP-binding protein yptV2 [Blattamonas nauphoetae]|uniref:GTP-binding protein yptV2 n=1 Tax=Blattamonas nauphoetae TaxID=2049346 RepID=A0ABQ9YI53_9EUKA|nr:putative GTP-binding protein yptV2 [Blattamonas nauphoetae]
MKPDDGLIRGVDQTITNIMSTSSRPSQRFRIKIISLGDKGVGKSCLIKRFCEKKFVSKYIATIGIDYGMKPISVGGTDVRVNLFDFSGADHYFEIRNEFYKDTQGVLLTYDVTTKSSFQNLQKWLDEGAQFGLGSPIMIVVANKTDLGKRAVSEKEGKAWAQSKGLRYYETSCSSGSGVDEAFMFLITEVATKYKPS